MSELRGVAFAFPAPNPDSDSTESAVISIDTSSTFLDLRRKIARQQRIPWTFRIRESDRYPEDKSAVFTPERTFDEPFFLEPYPDPSATIGSMKLCFKEKYFIVGIYLNETVSDVTRILQTGYGFGENELIVAPRSESVACYADEILWNLDLSKFYDIAIVPGYRSIEPPKVPEPIAPPPVETKRRSNAQRSRASKRGKRR
jgi:hypothetical protein